MEHLQECMTCPEAQVDASAEDMYDLVTKRIEMALIRYSPQFNTLEVQPQPDWRLRQTDEARDEARTSRQ